MASTEEIWEQERRVENRWAAVYDHIFDHLQPAYRLYKMDVARRVYQVWRNKPGPVVEIGCGTGLALRCVRDTGVPESLLCGVDISESMVHNAGMSLPESRFIAAPFETITLDEQVQVAYFSSALHHLPDKKLVGAKLREIVRPGGYVLVGEPNEDWLFQNVWLNRLARVLNPLWLWLWMWNRESFRQSKRTMHEIGESAFHEHLRADDVLKMMREGFRLVEYSTDFGVTRLFESVIVRAGQSLSLVRWMDAWMRSLAPQRGGKLIMMFQREGA
jgi:ubiquinone/menaquinone biosynthesis C-methylase UbiE